MTSTEFSQWIEDRRCESQQIADLNIRKAVGYTLDMVQNQFRAVPSNDKALEELDKTARLGQLVQDAKDGLMQQVQAQARQIRFLEAELAAHRREERKTA
jgi:hypothetical protein